jgi:serine/threonine protein kinase
VIQLASANKLELVQREVERLRVLQECRNVVTWNEDIAYDPERFVVHLHSDFYPEGWLSSLMEKDKDINKKFIYHIMTCLTMALKDCHERGIYHQDIRPRNSKFGSSALNRERRAQLNAA